MAPIDFEQSLSINDTAFSLSGLGVLTYLVFFRISHGALYLPHGLDDQRVLENVPKRLEAVYRRPFKAEDIGKASIAGIWKNVGKDLYDRLSTRIAYHSSLYEDLDKGDYAVPTYLLGRGVTLAINGKANGTVQAEDFARALFGLWLGDRPFDSRFKQALLGENR